jgi:GR25 family glycosyltransferase involved in LPS biosynthesis
LLLLLVFCSLLKAQSFRLSSENKLMVMLLFLVYTLLAAVAVADKLPKSSKNSLFAPGTNITCTWKRKDAQLQAYWINLDRSVERREHMEQLLQAMDLTHTRIPAVSISELTIPEDVRNAIESKNPELCVYNSTTEPGTPSTAWSLFPTAAAVNGGGDRRKLFVKGACGSGANTVKELATVISHLLAIQAAVYSTTSSSRYALILEDDVWSPFDIDFFEFLEQMPDRGFGIIQLFNSKPLLAGEMVSRYKKLKMLWYIRPEDFNMRHLPSLSTGAYIINRETMKPIIDGLLELNPITGWTSVRVLAGTTLPTCKPSVCCPTGPGIFNQSMPTCIWAPVGFQADSFLYALARTYVFTIPLFIDGTGSDDSTIHQAHVIHQHKTAFRRIRDLMNIFLTNEVELPFYIQKACPSNVLGITAAET